MPDLTTAQRLAAYQDELVAAGFNAEQAWRLVESAAPSLVDEVDIQADLDGRPKALATITVDMVAKVDEGALERVSEAIRFSLRSAASGDEGTASAHA